MLDPVEAPAGGILADPDHLRAIEQVELPGALSGLDDERTRSVLADGAPLLGNVAVGRANQDAYAARAVHSRRPRLSKRPDCCGPLAARRSSSPSSGSQERNRMAAGTASRCGGRLSASAWFSTVVPSQTFGQPSPHGASRPSSCSTCEPGSIFLMF